MCQQGNARMMRFFFAPVIRVAYGIQEAGHGFEVYRDTVRLKGDDEAISRKVLIRCDSRSEAESELDMAIRRYPSGRQRFAGMR